jgi:hypothetical protein
MLEPPSRKIALILFAAISCCAFCTRAARCSFVMGFTLAVIDFKRRGRMHAAAMTPPGACAARFRERYKRRRRGRDAGGGAGVNEVRR